MRPILALLALSAAPVEAQSDLFRLYYQNVPLWSAATELFPGGFRDFNRLRFTAAPGFGKISMEVAYEQLLTLRESASESGLVGTAPGGGEWLELQWILEESEHVEWQHRFDRLRIGWTPAPAVQVDVGRQAVSWATTLFFTPADPFSPFDPADPFREFRAGVDAARLRIYPGPLSEVDFVVRPTKTDVGEELTALGRGLVTWRNWEISGWAGTLYHDAAGAFAGSGALGPWALRGESVIRSAEGEVVFRGSIGVDRRFTLSGRDLLLVVEYQHDGFGAEDASAYSRVLDSEPFRRGELQVLGRDEGAFQGSYQVHPLLGLSGLVLWNMSDGSALLSPGFAYSASDDVAISGGLFLGFGAEEAALDGALPSEYGPVPATAYVSASFFF